MLTRNPRKLRRPRPSFLPTDLQPAIWFDASRLGGFADGDDVSTLPDLSRNGHDGTQGTAADKPHYDTGNMALPSLLTDGTDDHLDVPFSDLYTAGSGSFTLIAALRAPTGDSRDRLFFQGDPGTSQLLILAVNERKDNNASPGNMLAQIRDLDGNQLKVAAGGDKGIDDGNTHVCVWKLDGPTNSTRFRVDGVDEGAGVAAFTETPNNFQATGRDPTVSNEGDGTFGGNLGEMVLFQEFLPDLYIRKIENYLMQKWKV